MFLQRGDKVRDELHGNDDARAHGGADDVVGLRVAQLPFPTSGITSQKVSVKSNGVWAIEQKFA